MSQTRKVAKSNWRAQTGLPTIQAGVTSRTCFYVLVAQPLSEITLMLHSEPEQSVCSLDSKLAADVCSIIFHRAVVDRQFRAYLFTRQAISDQEQDTVFRRSEIAD